MLGPDGQDSSEWAIMYIKHHMHGWLCDLNGIPPNIVQARMINCESNLLAKYNRVCVTNFVCFSVAESILEKYQDFCQEKQTDRCQEKCRESSYSTCKCSCIRMRSGTVSSFTVLPLNFVLLFLACVAHNIILVL